MERNRTFLIAKNFPTPMLIAAPFVSLRAVLLARGLSLSRQRERRQQFAQESGAGWRLPWFVLKAHLALFANLGRLFMQRRSISLARPRLSDATIFAACSAGYSISARQVAEY